MVCLLLSKSRAIVKPYTSQTFLLSETKRKAKKRWNISSITFTISNWTKQNPNQYTIPSKVYSQTIIQSDRCAFYSALWEENKKKNKNSVDNIRKEIKRFFSLSVLFSKLTC